MARIYGPGQLTKAWIRSVFGVIVAYLLISVYDSMLMAALAFAFLFFLPLPDEKDERAINGIVFTVLMIFILFFSFINSTVWGLGLDFNFTISGAAWFGNAVLLILFVAALVAGALPRWNETSGFIKYIGFFGILVIGAVLLFTLQVWTWNAATMIFIILWMIGYFTGSTGDVFARQEIGVIIIVASFVIFSMGVGTQSVGTSFFGQWWPSVYNFGQGVIGPLQGTIGQIGQTFGTGIEMLINPMAFAQRIMNGTYAKDPTTGLSGAYGIEVEEFRLTPVYPYQSYSAVIKLSNKGAFDTVGYNLALVKGEKATQSLDIIKDLGFSTRHKNDTTSFPKLDVRQVFLDSKGITCKDMNDEKLRKVAVPLGVRLDYDYEIHSTMEMEFISQAEWSRIVKEEGRSLVEAKKPTTLTNAPVQLNIDTLGQPIREGTQFFVGLQLVPAQSGGKVKRTWKVYMDVPSEFIDATVTCTAEPDIARSGDRIILSWGELGNFKSEFPKSNVLYCNFKALGADKIAGPTQTFLVKANASYRYERVYPMTQTAQIQLGGGCCSDDDCPKDRPKCTWEKYKYANRTGECTVTGVKESTATVPTVIAPALGAATYCRAVYKKTGCELGEGGCETPLQCVSGGFQYNASGILVAKELACLETETSGLSVCCWAGATKSDCQKAFNERKGGLSTAQIANKQIAGW
jgi:hypothetical protein